MRPILHPLPSPSPSCCLPMWPQSNPPAYLRDPPHGASALRAPLSGWMTSRAPNLFTPTSSEGEGGQGSGLQMKASFRRSSMPLFITLSSLG